MIAAEHTERQVAVVAIKAVEEPSYLMAMKRDVGGVEVDDDLGRDLGMGLEEEVDQQALRLAAIVVDPVIYTSSPWPGPWRRARDD